MLNEYILHSLAVVTYVPYDKMHLVLAKKIVTENISQCFIKYVDGSIVCPRKTSVYELRKNNGSFVRVREEVYDLYVKFLNGDTKVPIKSIERLING